MNVWLIHLGEQLPIDGVSRQYRYGMLADALVARGDQVVRWAPSFVHATKTHRCYGDQTVGVSSGYTLELVDGGSYTKNISLQRLRFHRMVAGRFEQLASNRLVPDLIVCGMPTPEMCRAALAYGRRYSVPVVIDIRDPWPDIYLDAVPSPLRRLARAVLRPIFRQAGELFRRAAALCAVSQSYLSWGLRYAQRDRRLSDRVFYIGYKRPTFTEASMREAQSFWASRGVAKGQFTCVFFGTLCHSIDLDPVLHVAKSLPQVRFILCGDGESLPRYRALARGVANVDFPGWLRTEQILALMDFASVALAPYRLQAHQSLPNKPFEYLAGRLPILSSLPGELAGLLREADCGLMYEPGNAAQLRDHILTLQTDASRLEAMRCNAATLYASRGDADQIYKTFADYLREVYDRTRCPERTWTEPAPVLRTNGRAS